MVCRERGCLEDLYDCRNFAYDQAVTTLQYKKMYNGRLKNNNKSLYGLISECKRAP